MDVEKKAYAITDRAGFYVAGRKVPSRRDEDGNLVPQVGFILWLTEPEARHELRNLTIQEVDPNTGEPIVHETKATAPAGDAPVLDAGALPATSASADESEATGKRKKSAA